MQPLSSPTLPRQDVKKSKTVFVCLCPHMLFSVTPVFAGRSCLRVALSHHLFLARLLISVLIISCPPISVWVRRTGPHALYLNSSLFLSPNLFIFWSILSIVDCQTPWHLVPPLKQLFCVVLNKMWSKSRCHCVLLF